MTIMSLPYGKQRCKICGRICTINRHETCWQCRVHPCPVPNCKAKFIKTAARHACTKHNSIKDLDSYIARRESSVPNYKSTPRLYGVGV